MITNELCQILYEDRPKHIQISCMAYLYMVKSETWKSVDTASCKSRTESVIIETGAQKEMSKL